VLGYSSEAQSSRNTSAVARLFGEFRTSMSDIMCLKTERYLHSGVGYQSPGLAHGFLRLVEVIQGYQLHSIAVESPALVARLQCQFYSK